jgi:hypothetical protein
MNILPVSNIIVAILNFLGGAGFVKIINHFREKTRKKHLEKLSNNLQDLSQIYRIIEQLLQDSGADKVLILRASNGGGIPKPGSEMFTKLLYASTVDEDLEIYQKYNSIKIDGPYVDMLIDIQKNGQTYKVIKDMPNSLLKRLYQSENIQYSEIYFLGNNANEMYYCIVDSMDIDKKFEEPNKRLSIELGINDVKKIFNKHLNN